MTDENGTYAMQEFALVEMSCHDDILLGSQALVLSENESDSSSNAKSGDLIIPGESENNEEKKKCVAVCDEWGRDCIINPKTGQRKCRRMCKSFGQECI